MSIVVAGAGTAGWMAALWVKGVYPDRNVTVVYDDKIPIIGVGESTAPAFLNFMRDVGISLHDIVKNCEATIKNAIKFTNWKGDGTHYYHDFMGGDEMIENYFNALALGIPLDKVDRVSTLSDNNKIFTLNEGLDMEDVEITPYAVHFNAKLMAEYLHKVGVSRGIKIVIGKIEDAVLDTDGYVTEIVLDTKQKLKTDFIFDCTGFSRFFVNKVYNSPVKSYENILPVKRAMPFWLDNTGTDPTPPFTEAIAMKYGWMWKIPVGKRYGCGYVFDSDLVSDEEAYEEICEVTKQKPHIRKKIPFKPEYHTKPFNKNVLALGLSHGFLEPLEATSLLITSQMLLSLFSHIPNRDLIDRYKRESFTECYNKFIMKYVDNCVYMVYIHYLTPRTDTEFWKNFKNNSPEDVSRILKLVKEYDVTKPNDARKMLPFSIIDFLKCMSGVQELDKELIDRNTRPHLRSEIRNKIAQCEYLAERSMTHDTLLNELTST